MDKEIEEISEDDLSNIVNKLNSGEPDNDKYLMYCSLCEEVHLFDKNTNKKCKKQKNKDLN